MKRLLNVIAIASGLWILATPANAACTSQEIVSLTNSGCDFACIQKKCLGEAAPPETAQPEPNRFEKRQQAYERWRKVQPAGAPNSKDDYWMAYEKYGKSKFTAINNRDPRGLRAYMEKFPPDEEERRDLMSAIEDWERSAARNETFSELTKIDNRLKQRVADAQNLAGRQSQYQEIAYIGEAINDKMRVVEGIAGCSGSLGYFREALGYVRSAQSAHRHESWSRVRAALSDMIDSLNTGNEDLSSCVNKR